MAGKVIQLPIGFKADVAKETNLIGRKIGEARRNMRLTQSEFARRLREYGVSVQTPAVNKWECGENSPNAYQLLAICHCLKISDGLDFFTEVDAPERVRLNSDGRMMLSKYREMLESMPRFVTAARVAKVRVPISELPVSAGTGDDIPEEKYEYESFPADEVPEGTDIGIRVHGDSMEPTYKDGQIVFVHLCESLSDGEVGIFVYEGCGYVKVYSESVPNDDELEAFTDSDGAVHPQITLISYNEKYQPIEVTSELKIVGRVLN